ncbi:hypothetical protein LCGC14_2115560, partial [marine sediment metagenome]
DLLIWGKDERMWRSQVEVSADIRKLQGDLATLFPRCRLRLTQSGDALVITGALARVEQVGHLRKLFDSLRLKYVDMTTVTGVQQVQIHVRVAEVSRTAIRALGINAVKTGNDMFGASTVGAASGGPINPIAIGIPSGTSAARWNAPFVFTADTPVSSSVTLFAGFPETGLAVFLQALKENQYLRILAEPTLVALSGEEASFLAGGEFPIPVTQGGSGSAGTAITIEYREFGVRLRFRPVVLGDGRIRLRVAPEVSELSDIDSVTIQGSVIPSLVVRKVETTLELKSGQTFAMAGLLRRTNSARTSRVPWLGEVPVLGALFRSVRYTKSETELVVLATVTLVEPLALEGRMPAPGSFHSVPNDWELFAQGQIQGKAPAKLSAADAAWLKEKGLHRLKGPGAWATYEGGGVRSRSTARPPGEKSTKPPPSPTKPKPASPPKAGASKTK